MEHEKSSHGGKRCTRPNEPEKLRQLLQRAFPEGETRLSVSSRLQASLQAKEAALNAKERARCGPVAPASGLCLTSVDYGDE